MRRALLAMSALALATLSHTVFAQQPETLRQIANGYITTPVQDQTALKGYWDFDVRFTPFPLLSRAGSDGITVFAMIEQQLGLKLDQGRVPTPVFVVETVNAEPTPNPSGVSAAIPSPPPMEFDVVAKTSTAVSGSGQNTNVDVDDLKAMLRQLITERFQLKSHDEQRPVTAYTLVADKPKMAKADPSNRTGFKEGPAPGQKDQRNEILRRMVTVRNMSMAQFAEDLQRIAGGYIRVPVEDQTALDGAYDFTLTFTAIGVLNAGGRGRGGDGGPGPGGGDALDPSGGLSVFDAVNRQLGLKLEMRKRPMKVLVIDSILEKPTDN